MAEEAKYQSVGPEHSISRIANSLADGAHNLAGQGGISKMDLCAALANAIGFILSDGSRPAPDRKGKPLTREMALERMNHLRVVMESAYDIRSTDGTS